MELNVIAWDDYPALLLDLQSVLYIELFLMSFRTLFLLLRSGLPFVTYCSLNYT